MPDPSLAKAISIMQSQMTKMTIIVIGLVIITWAISRLLTFILIERGGKEKIINWMHNSQLLKKILWIINPDIKLPERREILTESLSNKNDLKISYNSVNGQSTIEYLDEELTFSKRRALLLLFFYENQEGKKTYNDFNAWLYNRSNKVKKIDYRVFRQEIKKIHKTLENKSKYISKIINCVESDINSSTKANFYKYQPSLKKL
ncbi:MAG: hypothetical protein WAW11_03935 [Patescibacteria group bacterium]